MRTLLLAGAAALSLTALPAGLNAQSDSQTTTERSTPSADEVNARTVDAPATTTVVTDGNPATPARITTTNPGNLTSPPAQALNRTYPVCTRTLQDSCQNPGEGGAPGKSRALGYWPGEPASERTDRGG